MKKESPESFDTIEPSATALKGKIAYYYFHQTFNSKFSRSFTYYPNFRIALNIFKNSEIIWDEHSRSTLPSKKGLYTSIITYTRDKERSVNMNGEINKIGVIFEPLGINHFVSEPINILLKETISNFNAFGDSLTDVCKLIFESENIDQKRNLLDQFFLERINKYNHKEIISAVNIVIQRKGAIGVEELARQIFMTRKSLLRLFKRHICMSPKGFIDLVKFRHSIDYFKKFKGEINLTQLAHQSQYYDQSSFIKHFYASTGINPRKFFFELEDIASQETIWNLDLEK